MSETNDELRDHDMIVWRLARATLIGILIGGLAGDWFFGQPLGMGDASEPLIDCILLGAIIGFVSELAHQSSVRAPDRPCRTPWARRFGKFARRLFPRVDHDRSVTVINVRPPRDRGGPDDQIDE